MAKPFLPLVITILLNILMVILNLQSQIRDRETMLFELLRTRHRPSFWPSTGPSSQPVAGDQLSARHYC